MKLIIAGSRNVTNYQLVLNAIKESGFKPDMIVSGGANGVDKLGERYANENNLPVRKFVPNWNKFGRSAGPIRNKEMAIYSDALIAIWDGKSRGTKNMISNAKSYGLDTFVFNVNNVTPF